MSSSPSPWLGALGCSGLIVLAALGAALAWWLGGPWWALGVGTALSLAGVTVGVWRDWLHLENGCSILITIGLFLLSCLVLAYYKPEKQREQQSAPAQQQE